MANNVFCSSGFSKFESLRRKSNRGVVILLGLSLAIARPPFVSAQINQQQEQQQREEQQRQEQAREQQQRDQAERDRQAREEQQRQEQQRDELQRQEQAREQQQRDQAERDRQVREEQQRQEQQRREQEARQQQQRDELQRQEQERHRPTPVIPVHGSPVPPAPVTSPGTDPVGSVPGVHPKPCAKEPCVAPKPVEPDRFAKLCKDRPCPVCPPGQSPGKNNSCIPASPGNGASAPGRPNLPAKICAAGEVWNGSQCVPIVAQQCLPGETNTGGSCQADCNSETAGAQSYIQRLRMARQDKDSACLKNPTGDECQSAEATYQMRMLEYRNYLGGVATQCSLPDPISI